MVPTHEVNGTDLTAPVSWDVINKVAQYGDYSEALGPRKKDRGFTGKYAISAKNDGIESLINPSGTTEAGQVTKLNGSAVHKYFEGFQKLLFGEIIEKYDDMVMYEGLG